MEEMAGARAGPPRFLSQVRPLTPGTVLAYGVFGPAP